MVPHRTLIALAALALMAAPFPVGCGSSDSSSGAKGGTGGTGGGTGGTSGDGSGEAAPDAPGDTASESEAAPDSGGKLPCDPVAQDCADPSASRCTIDRSKGLRTTVCAADGGSVALGAACTVATDDTDDCVKGAFCSNLGYAKGGAHSCRKLCLHSAECAADEGCYGFWDSSSPEKFGICLPSCTPFGTDCPTGTNCKGFTTSEPPAVVYVCIYPGAGGLEGAECSSAYDCADNMSCSRIGTTPWACHAMCGPQHACAAGTCTPVTQPVITKDHTSPGFCAP